MKATGLTKRLGVLLSRIDKTKEVNQHPLISKLEERLADVFVKDKKVLFQKNYLFENSDYAADTVDEDYLQKIINVAKDRKQDNDESFQLSVRTLPLQTSMLSSDTPFAISGARLNTMGPIKDKLTGGPIWFDFISTKKLIRLYVEGIAEPVILFEARFTIGRKIIINPSKPELVKQFTIIADTVWIKGSLFSTSVPSGSYAGLRVLKGGLTLSEMPYYVGDKLTISKTNVLKCQLDLEQKQPDIDPNSAFGLDAKNATFDLPASFSFQIKNTKIAITEVGRMAWKIFGQKNGFEYNGSQIPVYNAYLNRIAIPMNCLDPQFQITDNQSTFYQLSGNSLISRSWWGIPLAKIDLIDTPEADGNGSIITLMKTGLSCGWTNLKNNAFTINTPVIIGEPGWIGLIDVLSNALGAYQKLEGWSDELNPFGTSVELNYLEKGVFALNILAKGFELVSTICNSTVNTDRPVKVDGTAVAVVTKNSLVNWMMSDHYKMILLADENILWDHKLPQEKIPQVKPYALAMHNALFTVTPVNGLVLMANIDEQCNKMLSGRMFLSFGLFSYLPTLPDPYAADLGVLRQQFEQKRLSNTRGVWFWLIAQVKWNQIPEEDDKVGVSFHFAPLTSPLQVERETDNVFEKVNSSVNTQELEAASTQMVKNNPFFDRLHAFALLDVSSKANQMGVAYSTAFQNLRKTFNIKATSDSEAQAVPIRVEGLDVVAKGDLVHAFTVPQISWEPVFNTAQPASQPSAPYDPPIGWNYYQNDGIPTRIGNLSQKSVALSPIPLAKFLVQTYAKKEDGKTYAMFNLPFGMVAFSFLDSSAQTNGAKIENLTPVFDDYIIGGIQLELTGKRNNPEESRLFDGYTFQLHNINNVLGNGYQYTNLAHDPDIIFNGEFNPAADLPVGRPAVPLEKIGLSGYGASTFSQWENKDAAFAETSQAFFNVATGRTSREVVQVKSMGYPFGIRFVRTITLFRMGNGYVARVDSGWQPQSNGLFDFRYFVKDAVTFKKIQNPVENPYSIYPGLIKGLYNIRNIREIPKEFKYATSVQYKWKDVGGQPIEDGPRAQKSVNLRAVSFDCDVLLSDVVEGGVNNYVSSSNVICYLQLAPPGVPIDVDALKGLMIYENGSIGGPINCTIKIAGTSQYMRLDRFDVNSSEDVTGNFVLSGAVRGSVVLPKDGSWTMVKHERGTGEVTPLSEGLSIPLICQGLLNKKNNSFPNVSNELFRIAYPGDLLKLPNDTTINFGFLQNMNSQKVLFLTPAFKQGMEALMSKTPPIMADAFRLMNSKGIFPNIGDAVTNLGTGIQLLKGIDKMGNPLQAFSKNGIQDLGEDVFEILELKAKTEAGKLLDQGYKLIKAKGNQILNDAFKFDLPSFEYPLVNLKDILKIGIRYKATAKKDNKEYIGKCDFDVDSFAGDLANTWKGRLNNLAMVVDLGPLKELMTIKGNFNSQKGANTDIGSPVAADNQDLTLPVPEIEFSDALDAIIKILEMLQALSTGRYGDALKQGLKVAMSNSANIWEYKFEATKEIALVRFPPEANLYEAPTTPLKLEASMSLGVFFNAALKVTTDPSQLLPTAGAFFKFHGGLQVMCVSLAAATIYAVGEVDLTLRGDTSPKISLQMKFGFGAQLTVGLPVIGTVSVLYMMSVEVYLDSTSKVKVTAILLFRGHAQLLGGLVGVTISIEARGSIEKDSAPGSPCNCEAQVTFALDISIFLVIDISFSESWTETRQIA